MTEHEQWLKLRVRPAQVLLVEDSEPDRLLCQRMMGPYNCDVDEAVSGAEAVELAARKRYDYVFLDYGLPDEHGASTFRRLRAVQAEICVVFITGQVDAEKVEAAARVGFTVFIRKPDCFTPEFFEELMRMFRIAKRPESTTPPLPL